MTKNRELQPSQCPLTGTTSSLKMDSMISNQRELLSHLERLSQFMIRLAPPPISTSSCTTSHIERYLEQFSLEQRPAILILLTQLISLVDLLTNLEEAIGMLSCTLSGTLVELESLESHIPRMPLEDSLQSHM